MVALQQGLKYKHHVEGSLELIEQMNCARIKKPYTPSNHETVRS